MLTNLKRELIVLFANMQEETGPASWRWGTGSHFPS